MSCDIHEKTARFTGSTNGEILVIVGGVGLVIRLVQAKRTLVHTLGSATPSDV